MNTAIIGVSKIKFNGYKIELSANVKGKPVARLYKWLTMGKNKDTYKLLEGYYFGSEERRAEWVKEKVTNINANIESDKQRKEAKKDAVSSHPFKAGDILYQSWGYDQTNIDFFEIIEVLPKSVRIRPIGQNTVPGSNGFMCENVTPAHGCFTGEEIIRPIKVWFWSQGGNPNFSVSNGRHSLSLYTHGEKGIYQSHYA